jgi:phage baseplate assembly protein V
MPNALIESAVDATEVTDRPNYGVAKAQVTDNRDATGQGRVQVRLTGLPPGCELWVRLAVQSQGNYFIPQVGEEVLIAFGQGDIMEPYVLGSLWNGQDRPPTVNPADAMTKRMICTPLGHEVELDDARESITITSSTTTGIKQKITVGPNTIEIETTGGAATLTLDKTGNVSIKSDRGIELKAPNITIEGTQKVNIKSSASTSINGGRVCDIQADLVKIN